MGDAPGACSCRTWIEVSIHAHVRWATPPAGSRFPSCIRFNPRPRTVGDRRQDRRHVRWNRFQSTPTYGGRRRQFCVQNLLLRVSIHAHVRWATITFPRLLMPLKVFQSTPTYGGRPRWYHIAVQLLFVSIHAHVRWATPSGAIAADLHFNVSIHAHVRWATAAREAKDRALMVFQSTPTYGGRPSSPVWLSSTSVGFNPRPRTVGDILL